jgi:hypothetical protein
VILLEKWVKLDFLAQNPTCVILKNGADPKVGVREK